MNEHELTKSIEESKLTVLKAIQKNLPADLYAYTEDVFQDTYLRYYLHFQDKPPLSPDALARWLYIVARNECRRTWRENRKMGSLPFHGDFTEIASHHQLEEENQAEQEREEFWIRKQVNELPEPFRQTTVFRMSGHKVNVIAKMLGVSTGTVKSRLARGREMLAKLMNKNKKEQGMDL